METDPGAVLGPERGIGLSREAKRDGAGSLLQGGALSLWDEIWVGLLSGGGSGRRGGMCRGRIGGRISCCSLAGFCFKNGDVEGIAQ